MADIIEIEDIRRQVLEEVQFSAAHRHLCDRIVEAQGWERFKAIREFYRAVMDRILAAERNQWPIDPYMVDWVKLFTPIEFGLWCDIRCCGIVMYPQFPVGRYFVDFGNPQAKLAFECDGAAWHKDPEKDAKRDRELAEMGWRVHRFTGRECLAPDEIQDPETFEHIPNPERAMERVWQIALTHGLGRPRGDFQ